MGKISVKHYFNNRLKSESINGEMYSPLYVQIVRNTKTHQIRSVFVTEKITEKQFQSAEIQELCRRETDFILSFFEFAESAVNDFSVSNSKTNLGKLFAFYNANIYTILNDYGFVDYATRKSIYEKLKMFISEKTGLDLDFDLGLTRFIINDIPNNFEFYDLSIIKDLRKLGIITDSEAGKKEFEILTLKYIIDKRIQGKLREKLKLTLFDWFSKRSEIMHYIEQKAQYSRTNEISEYAAEADTLLKSLFTDFYNIGIYKNFHKILVNADNTLSVVENGKEIHRPHFVAAKKWYE